jgi:hypothetical protein
MASSQRRAARAALLAELEAGRPWRQATAAVGLSVCRTTVYRLRKRAALDPETAISDGRHGHTHKLLPPIQEWIVAQCQADPHLPSYQLQATIIAQFGVRLSVCYLNRVRAALGLRSVRPKKTAR